MAKPYKPGPMERDALDFAVKHKAAECLAMAEKLDVIALDAHRAANTLHAIGKVTSRKPDPKFRGQE